MSSDPVRGPVSDLPAGAAGAGQPPDPDPAPAGPPAAGAPALRGGGRAPADAGAAEGDFRVIPLERIEAEHEAVVREAAQLLELAREQYRLLQDAEVECADGTNVGLYYSRLFLARTTLAEIGRQFTRSQASLVHRSDKRFNAARQVIGYCDEADTWANRQAAA